MKKASFHVTGGVCVLIDAANLESAVKALGWHIDYRALQQLFMTERLMHIRFYSVRHETRNQINFLAFLRHLGYKLVTKPLKVIKDPTRAEGILRKGNFDVEISVDALCFLSEYETLILFSGDSDFDYLVKALRKYGKIVIVVSSKNHVARELIISSNKYVDLKTLRSQIERKIKKSPSLGPSPSTGS